MNIPKRLPGSLKGLQKMIDYINSIFPARDLSILEIGSWVGVSTELFARAFQYVVACDPYAPTIGLNTKYNMKIVEEEFDKRMNKYTNVEKVKMTSEKYYREMEKLEKDSDMLMKKEHIVKYDVIYIDGAHDIVNITRDIVLWKSKCDLFLCGHDYSKKFPGVMRVVNVLLGKPDKIFPDTSWLIDMNTKIVGE